MHSLATPFWILSNSAPPGVDDESRSRAYRRCYNSSLSSLLRERFEVDLVVTAFSGSMWDTLQLVVNMDLLLGMHGAGMTNLLWIQKVRESQQKPYI